MNEEKMREEFEQQYCTLLSFKQPDKLFMRCENGAYVGIDVELQWRWWKAACASKQREIDLLIEALQAYATCSDGCTCGDGWSHTTAKDALFILKGEPK